MRFIRTGGDPFSISLPVLGLGPVPALTRSRPAQLGGRPAILFARQRREQLRGLQLHDCLLVKGSEPVPAVAGCQSAASRLANLCHPLQNRLCGQPGVFHLGDMAAVRQDHDSPTTKRRGGSRC